MTDNEFLKIKAQAEILRHVRDEYGENRSLGNVISNIEAKIKGEEKRRTDGFRPNSVGMRAAAEPRHTGKTERISKNYERGC